MNYANSIKAQMYSSIYDVDGDWVRIMTVSCRNMHQYPVPTEMVWQRGEVRFPTMARMWTHYMNTGDDFAIVEVWENRGDDGHTEYQLIGYAKMTVEEAHKYMEGLASPNLNEVFWIDTDGGGDEPD